MTLRTNPTCLVVQTRLFDSTIDSGFGKWIVFEPTRRRAHLAVGKDGPAPILRVLARMSDGAEAPDLPERQTEKLQQLALLVNDQVVRRLDANRAVDGVVGPYHRVTSDYPFHEYEREDWKRKDRRLMHQYASMQLPPPRSTDREGTTFELPAVPIETLTRLADWSHATLFEKVAITLRLALGPIGEIPGEFGPWYRRTSPSGGARHPTECAIVVRQSLGPLAAGTYDYDWQNHRLVAGERDYVSVDKFQATDVTFVLRSRVERPMWRYRDLRSFRPVLIDAGHVAETIRLLLGSLGIPTSALAGIPTPVSLDDVEGVEPPVFAVGIRGGGHGPHMPPSREALPSTAGDWWLTNPFLFMAFADGQLVGKSVWPESHTAVISDAQLWALTHAIPSTRGDREMSRSGMADACGITGSEFACLVDRQLLLPAKTAHSFYDATTQWTRAGWYLSLLLLLDAQRVSRRSSRFGPGLLRRIGLENEQLGGALANRRTTRVFEPVPVQSVDIEAILRTAKLTDWLAGRSGRVFGQAFDHGSGPFEWDPNSESRLPTGRPPISREEASRLTAGQTSVAAGSAAIWLVIDNPSHNPADYVSGLVALGAAGQRLCLAATAAGCGVFETPAILDSKLDEALGLDADQPSISYAFGIGRARE